LPVEIRHIKKTTLDVVVCTSSLSSSGGRKIAGTQRFESKEQDTSQKRKKEKRMMTKRGFK
jgi:hypothetical protein